MVCFVARDGVVGGDQGGAEEVGGKEVVEDGLGLAGDHDGETEVEVAEESEERCVSAEGAGFGEDAESAVRLRFFGELDPADAPGSAYGG